MVDFFVQGGGFMWPILIALLFGLAVVGERAYSLVNSSSDTNPIHTYTTSGTFDVSLSVTGDGGTDTLNSIENVTGSVYNDTLFGDGASNTLLGASAGIICWLTRLSKEASSSACRVSFMEFVMSVAGWSGVVFKNSGVLWRFAALKASRLRVSVGFTNGGGRIGGVRLMVCKS